MTDKTTRRNFLLTGAAVAGGIIGSTALQQNQTDSAQSTAQNTAAKSTGKMPERVLGRTEVKVQFSA